MSYRLYIERSYARRGKRLYPLCRRCRRWHNRLCRPQNTRCSSSAGSCPQHGRCRPTLWGAEFYQPVRLPACLCTHGSSSFYRGLYPCLGCMPACHLHRWQPCRFLHRTHSRPSHGADPAGTLFRRGKCPSSHHHRNTRTSLTNLYHHPRTP